MGNCRFRLSDMMPNSWFYKLKGMGRANRSQSMRHSMKKSQTAETSTGSAATQPPVRQDYPLNRASSYIPSRERTEKLPPSPVNTKASDTHFPVEPPRKSKRKIRRMAAKPCANAVSCRTSAPACKSGSMADDDPIYDTDDIDTEKPLEFDSCHVSSSTADVNIDVASKSSSNVLQKFEELEVVSELKLPPILTKPVKKEVRKSSLHETSVPKEHNKTAARRSASGIHRIKVRQNSPRIGNRKVQANRNQNAAATKVAMQQRELSESLVMIKSSSNPRRDFMESMMEMIVENNIGEPKDLEELLACYLSLNSKEYHEVIIKVFEHLWFVLTDIKM